MKRFVYCNNLKEAEDFMEGLKKRKEVYSIHFNKQKLLISYNESTIVHSFN